MEYHLTPKAVKQFLRGDFKAVVRDPLLIFILPAPLLIIGVTYFFVPLLTGLLQTHLDYDIEPYHEHIQIFFAFLPSMLFGMLGGFMLLDDQDTGAMTSIFVTPLGKGGYLIYRMISLFALSLMFTLLFLLFSPLGEFRGIRTLLLAICISSEASLLAAFLAVAASNKVEGLALGKLMGLYLLGIPLALFIPHPLGYAGGIFPPYWIAKAFITSGIISWINITLGVLFHGLAGVLALRFYSRKIY